MRTHHYTLDIRWTGNLGSGTSSYRAYSRDHEYSAPGRAFIAGSADAIFRGDAARYNPEELLVGALASCHMLWFLHQCADAGVVVESYEDRPEGTMEEGADGGGQFTEVTLRPQVVVRGVVDPERLRQLHERAHALCFLARSVRFPVLIVPGVVVPG